MKNKWMMIGVLLACTYQADAGLKIYYIRHAQGGHNVRKAWEKKDVPKTEWPSYVGNPDMFTPKGKQQVTAATEKLKAYQFDFIASSPMWRARNTILPYLRVTQSKAEVWPELREGRGNGSILSKEIPVLQDKILNLGEPIVLPEEELPFFMLRDDAKNNYSRYPEKCSRMLRAAYMKHALLSATDMIEKRFGGTDKSILLAGHHASGVSLLKLLLQDEPSAIKGLKNTGIWMVEQQEDGSYQLKIYNGKNCSEK
ncbi:MAG: histidine phosphatase family protein [Planctomycetaceae bacterium]|nr:histidine phosphatase family protein [Planctomycetaceae bacterium]